MKKKYIIPEMEVLRMNTADVMHAGQESDQPLDPAPARRVPTLGNDSVKAF